MFAGFALKKTLPEYGATGSGIGPCFGSGFLMRVIYPTVAGIAPHTLLCSGGPFFLNGYRELLGFFAAQQALHGLFIDELAALLGGLKTEQGDVL